MKQFHELTFKELVSVLGCILLGFMMLVCFVEGAPPWNLESKPTNNESIQNPVGLAQKADEQAKKKESKKERNQRIENAHLDSPDFHDAHRRNLPVTLVKNPIQAGGYRVAEKYYVSYVERILKYSYLALFEKISDPKVSKFACVEYSFWKKIRIGDEFPLRVEKEEKK